MSMRIHENGARKSLINGTLPRMGRTCVVFLCDSADLLRQGDDRLPHEYFFQLSRCVLERAERKHRFSHFLCSTPHTTLSILLISSALPAQIPVSQDDS